MKNFKLGTRLLGGFAAVLLTIGAIGLVSSSALKRVESDAHSIKNDNLPGVYLAGRMRNLIDDNYLLTRVLLTSVMTELDDRDREILRLRFEEDLTQQEIAEIVGVSQMQVSRLLRRSLNALRMAADRRVPAALTS